LAGARAGVATMFVAGSGGSVVGEILTVRPSSAGLAEPIRNRGKGVFVCRWASSPFGAVPRQTPLAAARTARAKEGGPSLPNTFEFKFRVLSGFRGALALMAGWQSKTSRPSASDEEGGGGTSAAVSGLADRRSDSPLLLPDRGIGRFQPIEAQGPGSGWRSLANHSRKSGDLPFAFGRRPLRGLRPTPRPSAAAVGSRRGELPSFQVWAGAWEGAGVLARPCPAPPEELAAFANCGNVGTEDGPALGPAWSHQQKRGNFLAVPVATGGRGVSRKNWIDVRVRRRRRVRQRRAPVVARRDGARRYAHVFAISILFERGDGKVVDFRSV